MRFWSAMITLFLGRATRMAPETHVQECALREADIIESSLEPAAMTFGRRRSKPDRFADRM
jgi:hypothetical protein